MECSAFVDCYDPALCAVVGRFFAGAAFEKTFAEGQAESCAEYWELFGVTLTAVHLYHRAHQEHDASRGHGPL